MLTVAKPGRYRVKVTLARVLDDGHLVERELAATPAEIDVPESGPPPTIPITLDVDELRRLVGQAPAAH